MKIAVLKETRAGETRIPIIPATAEKLVKLGAEFAVETGLGAALSIPDEAYSKAGATVAASATEALADAAMVLRMHKPSPAEVEALREGQIHVSYLDPFNEKDLVRALASRGVSAISLEMIPRSTIAQKMDVLSSQANLAGYVAVIIAAERLAKVFPMMSTPAGTLSPSRVFVIGAGVAGLQAIATAKRLGAVVEAFDTRPVVEEQVKSLGARFVKVDLGETGQTKDGYAKALTEEQLAKQREAMGRHCASADIVITTAQVFGRKAPVIVTDAMLRGMQPGSVVVDLAVETGGNVEGSVLNQDVDRHGVAVVGLGNLPGRVAVHASQMFSSNLGNLVEHFWNKETKAFTLDPAHELIRGCLITHGGAVVHETIRTLLDGAS